ncbi:tectonin beta-propeller repeat-containing protein isoform X1 [Neodiprion fabricii]|uniref:tectonin beta-propeller repeat-containing protein isoform X1 n=2 Tax=Neodiprion fabricii TaxID=2872261 RepID=UPI001ED917CB|nr:tectonin beta-propeller repeat-containing protein isoform X1 [Neodiprion fabricii]XP_046426691.1 tectonin beta-propeller repeat-containing protein isoform X1 [Neodiprion fabricii]XP_046426692.1 tectonin beta-propeller repeat-containing protein isoform X1 [Neodiprion fabricii]XP_046426693.1 tectonin beta-propeller repeat-containing protein isoform X1 [Neodiprion fabricii]XP_046426695.1 tectonin beta-propeller repeat-containing protein isoform X1 [Neodiprion fabricii]
MPSSYLYAINNEGRVFGLSTSGNMWREFMYLGLEFKQLSAVPHFMWAIGGDRQVYVHVHGLDIPIRIKEETYENERWLPLEGFSGRLLPTDRYNFSSQDGTVDRSRDKVKLPSMAWQWEGDWHIETTLDGQPLDHDGWTYAVDFPATYSTNKQWKSCVRRRKWVRYRRYSAMNSWCAIAPLHKDATKEPFIDVAVGGNQILGGHSGNMVVWAVTAHGRIMFRVGVSTTSPEGQRWSAIKMSNGYEAIQVSVGPTGLAWIILTNGKALVRTGVCRENLMGDGWAEVEPPNDKLRLTQVGVGIDSVWAVTNDGSVWFRKGVNGQSSMLCEQMATGTGWVDMLSKMALVSVSPDDQVWAIGHDDRCLYYRTGIRGTDRTGKKWRMINAPLQLSRASSNASLSSSNRHSLCGTPQQHRHQSWGSLSRPHSTGDGAALIKDWEEQSRSAPTPTSLKLLQRTSDGTSTNNLQQTSSQESYLNESKNRSSNSVNTNDLTEASVANITISNESLTKGGESIVVSGKGMSNTVKVNPAAWSPVHSVGSMVGVEAHPETDGSVFDPDLTGDSGVYGEDENTAAMYWAEYDVLWCKIEAGACFIDQANPPKWMVESNGTTCGELTEPWREHILCNLKKRLKDLDVNILSYEKAIEMSSCVKNGDARCQLKGSKAYQDCVLELEWISNTSGYVDSGTLTILNTDGATTMLQFPISEIVCVVSCSEPGNPRLAIHTPNLSRSKILRLQFASDTEMEDWMDNLTTVSCQINNLHGKPGPNSIWATTGLGDVFVYDTEMAETSQLVDGVYTQELLTSGNQLPFESILHNGFGPGSSLHMSLCLYDDADRLAINLVCYTTTTMKQQKAAEGHDIALHFNPRLNEDVIVRNTYQSGQWGDEERVGVSPLKAGSDYTLKFVCEEGGYRIFINDIEYTFYSHRIPPENITHLRIKGLMTLSSVCYKTKSVIIEPIKIFWRQMGGHLRKVETCSVGVTWGIGYDNTAYVYTGGWGGNFLKGLRSNNTGINSMVDTHNYFVYENQRWNPVTGYTSHGLPTDRYMWSDVTGRHKRTREHTKTLSMHWQWVSDWIIDFHTPGGVDRDGWQYAMDFPAQYHGRKQFTDYVRRRRWFRRCQLKTSGPWQELGNTKIVDISLYTTSKPGDEGFINVWAVAANGEALFRRGVSELCPLGVSWEHIPSDQALIGISCGPEGQVWAVGKNGTSYWRLGISLAKPTGETWQNVEPPSGAQVKQISVGKDVVWALDTTGRLSVRREVRAKIFPEGTYWQTLPAMPNDPIHIATIVEKDNIADNCCIFYTDTFVPTAKQGFRHVSVGREKGQVWALSGAGIVCRRIGITDENPAGTGWTTGIGANWQYISAGGLVNRAQ